MEFTMYKKVILGVLLLVSFPVLSNEFFCKTGSSGLDRDIARFFDSGEEIISRVEYQENLSPEEKEYWLLKKELKEYTIAVIQRMKEVDEKLEKKTWQILRDVHGVKEGEGIDSLKLTDEQSAEIARRISRMRPQDPSLDSIVKGMREKTLELQKQIEAKNKKLIAKFKNDPNKGQAYRDQITHNDIQWDIYKYDYLWIRHNRISENYNNKHLKKIVQGQVNMRIKEKYYEGVKQIGIFQDS
jgi:hypothetical protein